jgi:hypothetical protein
MVLGLGGTKVTAACFEDLKALPKLLVPEFSVPPLSAEEGETILKSYPDASILDEEEVLIQDGI